MRSFSAKAAAMRVPGAEFSLLRSELDEALLDEGVKAGGNQYDIALQYILANELEADCFRLRAAEQLSALAPVSPVVADCVHSRLLIEEKNRRFRSQR